jgi:hypothetical protein
MAPWRKKGTSSSKSFPRAQFQPASGRVCALGGPLMQPARPVCSQICIHVSRFSFSTREFRPQKNVYINIYVCLSWGVGGSWKSAWSAGCIPFFTWPSILPAVEKERERWKRERNKARWREEKFERKVAQLSAASASLLAIPAPLGYLDACERAER